MARKSDALVPSGKYKRMLQSDRAFDGAEIRQANKTGC